MKKRSPPFTKEQLEYIHSLKSEGVSIYKISVIMDCSMTKIEWVFLTESERKAKYELHKVYQRHRYVADKRSEASNVRYATDPVFKARRKQVSSDYYNNVVKPARELWRQQDGK